MTKEEFEEFKKLLDENFAPELKKINEGLKIKITSKQTINFCETIKSKKK